MWKPREGYNGQAGGRQTFRNATLTNYSDGANSNFQCIPAMKNYFVSESRLPCVRASLDAMPFYSLPPSPFRSLTLSGERFDIIAQ